MKKITLLMILLLLMVSHMPVNGEQLRYKNIFIRWKVIRGVFGYRVFVKDKKNKEIIDRIVDVNSVTMRIPEGNYLLRIGSLNRSKRVENWSDWKPFTIVVNNPPNAPEQLIANKINNITILELK